MLWDIYEDIIVIGTFILNVFLDVVIKLILIIAMLWGVGAMLIDVTFKFSIAKAILALFIVPILLESITVLRNGIKNLFGAIKEEYREFKEEIEELREEKEDE